MKSWSTPTGPKPNQSILNDPLVRNRGSDLDLPVFIHYDHEKHSSRSHKETVADLAEKLRAENIPIVYDRDRPETETLPWALWTLQHIRSASHIVAVASPMLFTKWDLLGHHHDGSGVQWEARAILDRLYGTNPPTIVHVVLDESGAQNRPPHMFPNLSPLFRYPDDVMRLVGALRNSPAATL